MPDRDPILEEENVQRLVQAGLGVDARPSAAARVRTLARLRGEQRLLQPVPDFPLSALCLLVIVLLGVGVWLVSQSAASPSPGAQLAGVVLGLNLIWVPVASLVIIQRRRHVA